MSAAAEIRERERVWADVILRRDVAAAEEILAPEYRLVIGVEGSPLVVYSREQWLATLPQYVVEEHGTTDMQVSVWGDVGVAMLAHFQRALPLNGRDITGNFVLTDVWVRRDGVWRVAERHSSRQEKGAARG